MLHRQLPMWVTAAAVGFLLFSPVGSRGTATGPRSRDRPPRVDDRKRLDVGGGDRAVPTGRPHGLKAVVFQVYKNISSHRVLAIAAGVTFYAILAVFPAVAALVSLYGLFADAGTIAKNLDQMSALLPGGAIDVVRDQMIRVVSKGNGSLGVTFAISLGMALWSANAGIKALFDALNVVYAKEEKRGFIKLNAVSLAFTTGAILFMLVAMGAFVALPPALEKLGFGPGVLAAVRFGVWPIMFLGIILGLALVYRYGPSRDEPQWHWFTWGNGFASVGWLASSMLFSWYAANFGSFNETYGSLGAIIGFMTWIWISVIVVLIGAELNAMTEEGVPPEPSAEPTRS